LILAFVFQFTLTGDWVQSGGVKMNLAKPVPAGHRGNN
jgi:hypothetical protein